MIFELLDNQVPVDICPKDFVAECERCADAYGHFWRKCVIHERMGTNNPLVFVVDDTQQPVGAFKIRGASVAIHELLQITQISPSHICAASSGSFGMSIAYVAQRLGLKATIFMPGNTPQEKRRKIEKLGATVNASQKTYELAKDEAKRFAKEDKSRLFLDGVSWEVFKGNGSLALELVNSGRMVRSKLAVVVPLGIGSLAVPTALILQKMAYDYDLFVVEPLSYCKFLAECIENIHPVGGDTLAEGAAVAEVPEFSKNILDLVTYGVIALSEEEIVDGIRYLWHTFGIKSEGAGALAIAAYLSNPDLFEDYDQAWTVVTGKNVEDSVFQNIINS